MSKKSTALVLGSVPSLLDQLNEKIAKLKHIEESVYKTSGDIEGFPNIKTEMKVENLIRAFGSIRARETGYVKAATELDLKTFPAFSMNGYTTENFKEDVLLRKAIIEHKETLDKLNEFKDKASKFLSAEDQKSILFAEMESFFTGGGK